MGVWSWDLPSLLIAIFITLLLGSKPSTAVLANVLYPSKKYIDYMGCGGGGGGGVEKYV